MVYIGIECQYYLLTCALPWLPYVNTALLCVFYFCFDLFCFVCLFVVVVLFLYMCMVSSYL